MEKNEVKNETKNAVNLEQDFAHWLEAAEQGDAEAQYNVGCCYYSGEGIAEDKSEAFNWFVKSAALDDDDDDDD